jgi:CheY-like chemotaxis protein
VTTPLNILLVEDDEDDRFLAERALRKAGLKVAFHATDGRVAVDYLSGEGKFGDRNTYPLPDVVLVDLKIPEITGHQILEWINTQEHLKACRAYILSSSGEVRDRERAEAAKVTDYFIKPLTEENIAKLRNAGRGI